MSSERQIEKEGTHPHAFLFITVLVVFLFQGTALGNDVIAGYYSCIFRSYSDRTYEGTDFREEVDNDHYTLYHRATVRRLKIYQTKNFRIFGTGSGWLRLDLGDKTFDDRVKADLSFGSIQIDRGRTTDGFIRLGRIYNYQGLLPQRFDGGEIFFKLFKHLEFDIYGGRRPIRHTNEGGDNWLGGGRMGYRFKRRNTIGCSWLLERTDGQWDDGKIGGDWSLALLRWLYFNGTVGYDWISKKIYEVNAALHLRIGRDFDVRLEYDKVIPGLFIPKSSIFSVYSLAEEESGSVQLIYHPGERWTFSVSMTAIDYDNEGGKGGANNFFTTINAIDGGHQWRVGGEVGYRHNLRDSVTLRFEKMADARYGYTVTDAIRNDFDFRDFDPLDDEGFVFGPLENGFSSFGLSHWHQWSRKFSHALNFYYYAYDNRLYLHREGNHSFSSNLTFSYKVADRWNVHLGGRYIGSLADEEELQWYGRLDTRF